MTNSSKGDFKIFNFVEDFMMTDPTVEKYGLLSLEKKAAGILLIYLGSFEVSVR